MVKERWPDSPTLAAFVVIVLLGGLNAVAIRFSNQELPPFWGAMLRFGSASIILFAFVRIRRLPLPTGRLLGGVVLYGFLGFGVGFTLVYWSLVYLRAGLASIFLALIPLHTFFFTLAHGQETFRWRALFGGFLAVMGVMIVFQNELMADTPFLPLVTIFIATMAIAESNVIIKGFPDNNPITTNAIGMAIGAAVHLGLSFVLGEAHPLPSLPSTWVAVIFLILVSCFIFSLYLFVVKRWTASGAAYQFVLIPFVTIAAGAWLAREPIFPAFLLGGAIVLIGVYVGALVRTPAEKTALEKPADS